MNLDKFTRKSHEALNTASALAAEKGHPELVPMHLVHALISDPEGLVPSLFSKLNIEPAAATAAAEESLRSLPQASGPGVQTAMSRSLIMVLTEAERKAAQMKDDFVSVEHLLLAALIRMRRRANSAAVWA